MNVSKINILNTHKTGVSPFRGDTPVYENNIKQKDKSKEFLHGAVVVSAGILAVALAGRAGVFSKFLQKSDKSNKIKIEPDALKNNPVAEIVKTKESFSRKTLDEIPAAGICDDEINPLILKSKFDYTKFDINSDTKTQSEFYQQITSELHNLSYEEQYEEFKFLLEFLENSDSSKLKGTVPFSFYNFKRDNASRCKNELIALVDRKPELGDLFRKNVELIYREGGNYRFFNRLKNDTDKAVFFTNTFNKILKSGDNLEPEFDKYLDFIKTVPADDIKYNILFIPGQFPIDKNLDMAKKVMAFAKENPEYKDIMVKHLLKYEADWDFNMKLAYAKFHPNDEIQGAYDKHVENVINIRKELMASGLKCDEGARRILRNDWLNTGDYLQNQFNLGFQYSPRLPEIKKISFEYDLSHGLTRNEADEIIKTITARHTTWDKSKMDVVMGMKLEEMVEKINNAVVG